MTTEASLHPVTRRVLNSILGPALGVSMGLLLAAPVAHATPPSRTAATTAAAARGRPLMGRLAPSTEHGGGGRVFVHGYTRSNGTRVHGYWRNGTAVPPGGPQFLGSIVRGPEGHPGAAPSPAAHGPHAGLAACAARARRAVIGAQVERPVRPTRRATDARTTERFAASVASGRRTLV